ncbi:HET-domain-containing protein [Patellaria atrata CBS 101060]|uniref:HET-domain-containing protein n=1 Tax=Patellaria atrata CBS 101060 TaxID=1346257 RepID=A0A9P4SIJ3_9PEZI|nr:HET-domain-containing protein [Patellaria atrata CBS 101060]
MSLTCTIPLGREKYTGKLNKPERETTNGFLTTELAETRQVSTTGLDQVLPASSSRVSNLNGVVNPYLYEPLPSTSSIRIIELLPGPRCSQIQCLLRCGNVDSPDLAFEALSYVWGDEKPQVDIICDGMSLTITPNLSTALESLRYIDRPRFIWADAICINQLDLNERGHQVRLMRKIYKRAFKTLVWVGLDEYLEAPLAFIEKLAHPVSSNGWKSLAKLFQLPWFYRFWVIQEISLSSNAFLVWGENSTPWSDIAGASQWLRQFGYKFIDQYGIQGAYNAYLMDALTNQGIALTAPLTFLRLLGLTRQFHVTDPRDRIFAILGLPTVDADPENEVFFMEPDYTLTLNEVYWRVAHEILQTDDQLRLLSAVQHGPCIGTDLPSWVPRWDRLYTHGLAPSDPTAENHRASRGLLHDRPETPQFLSQLLSVKGIKADEVIGMTDIIAYDDLAFLSSASGIEEDHLARKILSFLEANSINHETSLKEIFWTVTAGKDWYGLLLEDSEIEAHFADFSSYWSRTTSNISMKPSETHDSFHNTSPAVIEEVFARLKETIFNACNQRRLFLTKGGLLGIGPASMLKGDHVCVILGAIVPYILRQVEEQYLLVGECYSFNLMHGEAVEKWHHGELEIESIIIR